MGSIACVDCCTASDKFDDPKTAMNMQQKQRLLDQSTERRTSPIAGEGFPIIHITNPDGVTAPLSPTMRASFLVVPINTVTNDTLTAPSADPDHDKVSSAPIPNVQEPSTNTPTFSMATQTSPPSSDDDSDVSCKQSIALINIPEDEPVQPVPLTISVDTHLSTPSPTITTHIRTISQAAANIDVNTRWVSPYSSEKEMLDNECISSLIDLNIPSKMRDVFGDPSSYKFPAQEPARGRIERDLRKIRVSLLNIHIENAEQRKYAKLCILKHYDLLTSIYKRYCKIGRDMHWMTMIGWISLLRDCGLLDEELDLEEGGHEILRYRDILMGIYKYHRDHLHSARRNRSKSRHTVQQSQMYGDAHFMDKVPCFN